MTPYGPVVDPSKCGFRIGGTAQAPTFCLAPSAHHIWWQQVDPVDGSMINSTACEEHWRSVRVEDVYLTHPYRRGGSACGIVGSIWDDADNVCVTGEEPDDELRAMLEQGIEVTSSA